MNRAAKARPDWGGGLPPEYLSYLGSRSRSASRPRPPKSWAVVSCLATDPTKPTEPSARQLLVMALEMRTQGRRTVWQLPAGWLASKGAHASRLGRWGGAGRVSSTASSLSAASPHQNGPYQPSPPLSSSTSVLQDATILQSIEWYVVPRRDVKVNWQTEAQHVPRPNIPGRRIRPHHERGGEGRAEINKMGEWHDWYRGGVLAPANAQLYTIIALVLVCDPPFADVGALVGARVGRDAPANHLSCSRGQLPRLALEGSAAVGLAPHPSHHHIS